MDYKFLSVIFLNIMINTWASESSVSPKIPYEVRIIFANNPFNSPFRRITLSNQKRPIKRFFANKSDAFEFVKILNLINEREPIGENRIFAMLRVINLSAKEQASLNATTVTTPDGKKHHITSRFLTLPETIYVQQMRPVKLVPTTAP